MLKTPWALSLQMLCICALSASAQPLRGSEELFSPTAALAFYEIAHDLTGPGSEKTSVSAENAEQALVFLTAAMRLDNQARYVLPDMLKVACRTESPLSLGLANFYGRSTDPNDPNKIIEPKDNSKLVQALLFQYVDEDADLQIAREAVRYLLSQLDSREQREQMLYTLLTQLRNKNDLLVSELHTSVGLLAVEKTDFENAQLHFITAINKNKYNRLAFDKLHELTEGNINVAAYLEHLRYRLGENPLDLQAALVFADRARQFELFQTASDAYAYCSSLFEYLYSNEPLPQYIYLPWALNTYSSPRNLHQALQIAERVRNEGTFDIVLETVAAKAAERVGNTRLADDILNAAQRTALKKYQALGANRSEITQQLAWFYCFGKVEPAEAIDWANRAYAADANNPDAAALLAYAFVLNEQPDWTKPFFETYKSNPILELARAQIGLADANNVAAVETLKALIAAAPESLEAHKARELLTRLNSVYIPKVDPDLVRSVLEASFGTDIVTTFLKPNEIFDAQLNIRGDKFAYGSDFHASVIIANKSDEPLVISEYGLLRGNIRIDATVSGDLNKTIPNLVSMKIQPSQPIDTDSTLIVPVTLHTGQLKELLQEHPQASLEIEFTLYLDDVILEDGTIANRLEDIKPVTAKIERPGINLTPQFLRNRVSSLKRRRQGQNTARLFAGLLAEQHLMAGSEPAYPFKYADWMPDLLESGLVYNVTSDDWPARIYTMQAVLNLPFDFELIEAVSENLSDENWPVRMMALYLLAKNQGDGFGRVLDHTAKYDQNKLVRDMAVALGGRPAENQWPSTSPYR
jgi:hypothetical protein